MIMKSFIRKRTNMKHIDSLLKSNFLAVLAFVAIGMSIVGCEAKFYDEEQYRKEIYIVSDNSNIFGQEYTFGEISEGWLSIYAGGTTPIEKDVTVELEHWPEVLRSYNRTTYGESYANYAQELDAKNYTIDNYTVVLSKDNEKPYTKFPIRVNVSNIGPDDVYYIPLRIKSVSDYMISPEKRDVLFRIYLKNDYATTKSTTYYTMDGTEQNFREEDGTFSPASEVSVINATKSLVPVDEHSVRILPSTFYSVAPSVISQRGIVVKVHPDQLIDVPVYVEGVPTGEFVKRQKVTLETWEVSSRSVLVGEVEGKQSYYDPATQCFTLNYRYKLPTDVLWHFVNEVMKPLSITND